MTTPAGVVLLGQVAARLRTDRLLAEHGPDLPMPALRRIIAADCPRMIAAKLHDVCGVHFPGLVGLTHG